MRKALIGFLGIAVTILLVFSPITSHSQAITVGFSPVSQSVGLGAPAVVDLTISGLVDYAPPSLSTFDLFIGYDPTILSLSGVTFGDQLNVLGLGSDTDWFFYSSGTEEIYELSFDSPDDLIALQLDSFTLATLTFDTLDSGFSSLNIVDPGPISLLGDEWGVNFPFDRGSGIVNVTVAAVPEPATFLLIARALPCLAVIEYFRRKRSKTR